MPENILGIGAADNSRGALLKTTLETGENEVQKTQAAQTSAKKEEETGLIVVDFENMTTEEVQQTVKNLQTELLMIKTELENLEELIKSDNQIRKNYEKQLETLKKEFEKVTDEINDEEDPNKKARLQTRVSGIKSSINMLLGQISSANELIEAHSGMASSLQNEYAQTNYDHQSAVTEQSAKQREALIAAAQSGVNSGASAVLGTTNVSNNANIENNTVTTSQKGASTGHVSDTMLNALKNWEGLRTTAYKCPAGVWTIGYGHTGGVSSGQTITEAQAEQYLRQDLQSFENQVTNMANSAGVQLSQGQYDALVSFAYNCGGGALQKSGILEMLKSGNVDGAAAKMNEYVHGGGKVLPGLVSRRKVESSWLYA